MITQLVGQLRGASVKARVLRSSGLTILNVGGSNFLRLLSNLVLTRLLFPEAFGLMSLMQVFIYGLQTFSDIGVHTMLIQHRQGGERRYLDTLWTLQILRGALLCILACLIARPVAQLYDQPQVTILLPVMALVLVINGFSTTKVVEANRELTLGRVVGLTLASQAVSLVAMAILAYLLRSVWALVFGMLIGAALKVIAFHLLLPGSNNRLRWERPIIREALNFGGFIFLSTICSFFINQGNQMILAGYIDIAVFGVFSIALMLATIPGMIVNAIATSVIFPLYRLKSPTEGAGNRAKLFRARRMVALFGMSLATILALIGIPLINLLYDDRYVLAGPIMVLIAALAIPGRAFVGSQEALNGHGDSRSNLVLNLAISSLQISLVYLGVRQFGIVGAILAAPITTMATYPLRAWLIARYQSWDPKGDAALIAGGFLAMAVTLWVNWPVLEPHFGLLLSDHLGQTQ